jgi:hypothetical protein
MSIHSGRLLALLTNIRLEWRYMTVSNTIAYYDMITITFVPRFFNKKYGNNWPVN